MITDFFTPKNAKIISTEFYELHRSYIERNTFKILYNELCNNLETNSSRKSCVCVNDIIKNEFDIYNLPLIDWTYTLNEIKEKILCDFVQSNTIDYGLVHYYKDSSSSISWHYDKEALNSDVYSISIGGTRRFCLRDKETKQILNFDLI